MDESRGCLGYVDDACLFSQSREANQGNTIHDDADDPGLDKWQRVYGYERRRARPKKHDRGAKGGGSLAGDAEHEPTSWADVVRGKMERKPKEREAGVTKGNGIEWEAIVQTQKERAANPCGKEDCYYEGGGKTRANPVNGTEQVPSMTRSGSTVIQ